jgi:predicted ArsR family transcriptional regulator
MRATEHARNTDPETSHAAAARIEPSGARHRARIMAVLERGPGTFEEIALRAELRDSQVWRRLPDLQKLGFAEPTGEERPGASGRFQRVWTVGKNWRPVTAGKTNA